ncbi:CDP-alcohol phosphatidyltransferase superfamily protein [Besnoitia besnoiti]|uniref:CDP-alcohol phosphatidyltransferase superfamily protein n=1 Tax=Besnoitia besnoiti TaxID=94643 RepID=A0A2A9MKV8_BESBE|nr:CDP-alcohol phosphatidyltransferase superfamily protein [Besnoitia besnoiti]PFH37874.1 CDP-alcohol phosphatidyltransferase superfamily protein [Besnoitia besnoiti]
MVFGHYIPPLGLKNLHSYKYTSGGYTPLDKLMNPWWEYVASLVPSTVHPNTLTVLGFLCANAAAILQLWHTPTLSEDAPRWVFFAVALLFFLYQTFDAIDGKHARRNNLSSPLGQLFDHGCDIILTTPLTLVSIAVITAGTGFLQHFIAMTSSQALQFIYMWWELHFHVFYAATGFIGVTEAQMGVMAMALISGVCGPYVWRYSLLKLLPSSSLKDALTYISSAFHVDLTGLLVVQAILIACNLPSLLYCVVAGVARAPKRRLAVCQFLGFVCYMAAQGALWHTCLEGAPEDRTTPGLIYLTVTTSYSILLLRICLSATCRFPFKLINRPVIPFFLVAIGIVACPWCRVHRYALLAAVNVWNIAYLADFLYTSVSDVCVCLGISCFRVGYCKKKKEEAEKELKGLSAAFDATGKELRQRETAKVVPEPCTRDEGDNIPVADLRDSRRRGA